MESSVTTLENLRHTHTTRDRNVNKKEEDINTIIDKVLVEEGHENFDEVDSLTTMMVIADVEDFFDLNLDLNILEGISGRDELVKRLVAAI